MSDQQWGRWRVQPAAAEASGDIVIFNQYLVVHADLLDQHTYGQPMAMPLLHLSFRRQDRDQATLISWRDKQRMKNELCGADAEGVEVFPAESRMVDGSDQYHLWVAPPGYRFLFGYHQQRSVSWEGEPLPAGLGGTQTPPSTEYLESARVKRGKLAVFYPSWNEWVSA